MHSIQGAHDVKSGREGEKGRGMWGWERGRKGKGRVEEGRGTAGRGRERKGQTGRSATPL